MQARAEATRSAVLRAAAVVFNRDGFAGATVADISREASVSKGAIQFHFPTKESLASAVVTRFRQDFDPTSGDRQHARGMIAAIELSAEISRQLIEEPIVGAAYRLSMEESAFAPRVTEPYIQMIGSIDRCFDQAQHDGELRQGVRARDLSRYLVASFFGVQSVSDTLTSRTDLIRRVADMWSFVLPSVAVPERLPHLLRVARGTFASHYTKSRADLIMKGIS